MTGFCRELHNTQTSVIPNINRESPVTILRIRPCLWINSGSNCLGTNELECLSSIRVADTNKHSTVHTLANHEQNSFHLLIEVCRTVNANVRLARHKLLVQIRYRNKKTS